MAKFTPPTLEGHQRLDIFAGRTPANKLFSKFNGQIEGITVWRGQDNVYRQTQYPYAGGARYPVFDNQIKISEAVDDPNTGLLTAKEVYVGGATYDVSFNTALELIAAGYGAFINIEPVELIWTPEQLSKLSRWTLTQDGSTATELGLFGTSDGVLHFNNAPLPNKVNQREFWVHEDTTGWTDFQAETTINPRNYAQDLGFGLITQQQGIVLRAQQSGGINTGITLNNNIFFVVANLNIGVWRSNTDGTGFLNRQVSLDIGLLLPLPYSFEAILTGTSIQVRAWQPGYPRPSFTDPIYAKTVDLNSFGDTGTIPTPTGLGQAGIIFAHGGSDPLASPQVRRTLFRKLA